MSAARWFAHHDPGTITSPSRTRSRRPARLLRAYTPPTAAMPLVRLLASVSRPGGVVGAPTQTRPSDDLLAAVKGLPARGDDGAPIAFATAWTLLVDKAGNEEEALGWIVALIVALAEREVTP